MKAVVPVTCMILPLILTAEGVNQRQNAKTSESRIQRRKLPDTRRLEELMEKGHVDDGITIEFSPNPAQSLNSRNSKGKLLVKHDDSEEVSRRAQRLLKQLNGFCTSARPTFRHAGKHQPDHIEFGLQYFYEFKCPPSAKPSSPNSSSASNSTSKNLFRQVPDQATKGQNTVAAMHQLKEIMHNEDMLKTKRGGANASFDGDNENYYNIKQAVAQQKIEDKEYLGPLEPEPVIDEYSHPELWKHQQQNMLAKQVRANQTNRHLQVRHEPNDKYYEVGYQSHFSAINLLDAWEYMAKKKGWRGSRNVKVQVLDSGWQFGHEDAGANKWRNRGEICGNGKDDDGNGYVDDCFGYNHADDNNKLLGNGDHGCHVTGTIAANTDNNGKGVAGVAGGGSTGSNRRARGVSIITSVGFGNRNTGGFAEALVYGADNGAKISSNSWGFTDPEYQDPAVARAIRYATRKKGVLVVFAAGNDNSNQKFYPAAMPIVLAVSATYNNGVRASFTNYGDWVDIAAPGTNVLSTSRGGKYKFKSGTSMACPHVAGVLAMGKSLHRNAKRHHLLRCIKRTARKIGDPSLGKGMVNPIRFLRCLDRQVGRRRLDGEDDDKGAISETLEIDDLTEGPINTTMTVPVNHTSSTTVASKSLRGRRAL